MTARGQVTHVKESGIHSYHCPFKCSEIKYPSYQFVSGHVTSFFRTTFYVSYLGKPINYNQAYNSITLQQKHRRKCSLRFVAIQTRNVPENAFSFDGLCVCGTIGNTRMQIEFWCGNPIGKVHLEDWSGVWCTPEHVTISVSCPMAGFLTSCVEHLGCSNTVFATEVYRECKRQNATEKLVFLRVYSDLHRLSWECTEG